MCDSPEFPHIPDDAAVAAVDGSVSVRGAAAGVVLAHRGVLRLSGVPLPPDIESWEAEALAAGEAISAALGAGARRLRLLIDTAHVAAFVQGRRQGDGVLPRQGTFASLLDHAREAGLAISARVVQGHTETRDLPSRMNDLAHLLGSMSPAVPTALETSTSAGWDGRLRAVEPRLVPSRNHHRWTASLGRRKTAHLLGLDVGTVDALFRAGHIDVTPEGVPYGSVARVYEAAQALREDAYFGFSAPEGVPGAWEDEIHRGWDPRPSLYVEARRAQREAERAAAMPREVDLAA